MAVAIPAMAATPSPGDVFPRLEDFKLAGNRPDLTAAKVTVVDFWASWCAPCKASFPVFDELVRKYGGKGLVVVAVSVDQKAAAMEKFLKATKPSFTILRDTEQKLVAAVDVPAMPTSFVLDGRGVVRFVHKGFHGDKSRREFEEQIQSLLAEQS